MPQRQRQAGAAVGGAPDALAPPGALNLRQGAEQIGGLNLFDGDDDFVEDDATGANDDDTGADESGKGNRKRKPENEDSQDDQAGDDDADGSQDTDDTDTDDDDSQSDDDAGDDSGQDTDNDDDEKPIESLAQLAEALEVDVETLAALQDTFKADGEDTTVSLAELRAGYQRDANYRRQTQELAETRRALEADYTSKGQHYEGQLVQLSQVLKSGEQLLVGQLDTAAMQKLRIDNPAEWAARREELQTRIQGIQQLYAHAAQEYDTYHARQNQAMTAQLTELRRQEMQNLMVALPDWGDDLKGKLFGYLDTSFGYTKDDLASVFDSRLIVLANKARLFDEMQAVGKKTRKKVTKLPKVQKPGKGSTKPNKPGAINLRKASQRLRQTGKVKDAAALIGLKFKDL